MGSLGALLFLLGSLGALADVCEIPHVDSQLVERMGQHLLPWMNQISQEQLNPSIYVGLRLSSVQAGDMEAFYLHSLKLKYQQNILGCTSSDDCKTKPSMGQLALYMLALRANCEFARGHKGDRLVSQLKRFLEDEKKAIGHNHKDYPYVSYYQYGLSILALCVHQKRVHDSVVKKLLYAVEHDQHFYQGTLSVVPDDLSHARHGAGHSVPQGGGCSVGHSEGWGLPECSHDFHAAACPEPQKLCGSHLPRLPCTKSGPFLSPWHSRVGTSYGDSFTDSKLRCHQGHIEGPQCLAAIQTRHLCPCRLLLGRCPEEGPGALGIHVWNKGHLVRPLPDLRDGERSGGT
ncbi:transcobalamin-2 isoform X3 [Equus asinus]|uniref:transcobalamin-2 isoform X3 n=1 Tax=Equus asinus TaxID=9793 RepID=UPI001D0369E2|nr:transcobalamin-2 isoform X3 [Equus asinus]